MGKPSCLFFWIYGGIISLAYMVEWAKGVCMFVNPRGITFIVEQIINFYKKEEPRVIAFLVLCCGYFSAYEAFNISYISFEKSSVRRSLCAQEEEQIRRFLIGMMSASILALIVSAISSLARARGAVRIADYAIRHACALAALPIAIIAISAGIYSALQDAKYHLFTIIKIFVFFCGTLGGLIVYCAKGSHLILGVVYGAPVLISLLFARKHDILKHLLILAGFLLIYFLYSIFTDI